MAATIENYHGATLRERIEQNQLSILPFELTIAQEALKGYIQHQQHLSEKLGEAMEQSSETWHDNAPAEAIASDSRTLAKMAEQTMRVINESAVFEYPPEHEQTATLGSIVDVRYSDDPDAEQLILTGATRKINAETLEQLELPSDIQSTTLSSPMGRALFGKTAGNTTTMKLENGREIPLHIEKITQYHFPQQ